MSWFQNVCHITSAALFGDLFHSYFKDSSSSWQLNAVLILLLGGIEIFQKVLIVGNTGVKLGDDAVSLGTDTEGPCHSGGLTSQQHNI